MKTSWFHSYQRENMCGSQWAFLAMHEKALLNLIYLHASGGAPVYLTELRLQAVECLGLGALAQFTERSGSLKLRPTAQGVATPAVCEAEEVETL